MKLLQGVASLLWIVIASHAQDISNNITYLSLGHEDTSEALNDLAQAIEESETCELDFNSAVSVADADDFYERYYKFCRVFCGDCSPKRRKRGLGLLEAGKTLTTHGECDKIMSTLKKAGDKLEGEEELMSSVTETTQSPYYPSVADFFCNENVGFCAGYYDYAWCPFYVHDDDLGRHLEKIENMSKEEINTEMGFHKANPDGIYSKKENVISEEACEEVKRHLDFHDESRVETNDNARIGEVKGRSFGKPSNRSLSLTGGELVNLIGKEDARSLLEFFHESLGRKAPVTKIWLQRTPYQKSEMHKFDSHIDGVDTMLVHLGNNGNEKLSGGGIFHYTGRGLMKTEMIVPGLTIVHGKDVLHETYPWTGVRDILDIQSNPGKAKEPCMLWDLVN